MYKKNVVPSLKLSGLFVINYKRNNFGNFGFGA